MKLCRFWQPGQGAVLGVADGNRVRNLTALDPQLFGSFTKLLGMKDLPEQLRTAGAGAPPEEGYAWADLDIPPHPEKPHLLAPITRQEVWAAGVTYLRSREARMEESSGGGSFYDKVYTASRPELFFKGSASRVAGPNTPIRIRSDSQWSVPEPELALVVNSEGHLAGFTVGNDVSARDIEGENPLYLPQAKVHQGSCALGPAVIPALEVSSARDLRLRLVIRREGAVRFEGATGISQMKRSFEDLIEYLFREQEFPDGVILLTGTGIVPPDDFTLQPGDMVEITVPEIGTLRNFVAATGLPASRTPRS
jgi:2-dehydro-3-deoxy-D-arabinonate dehydratase